MDPLMWGLLVVVHRKSESALLFPLPALSSLEQTNLIVYIKEEKTFKITEYGMHALKLYGEMDKLLVSRPINTVK